MLTSGIPPPEAQLAACEPMRASFRRFGTPKASWSDRLPLNIDRARGPNRSRSSESNRTDELRPIRDRRRLRLLPSRLSRQDCRHGADSGRIVTVSRTVHRRILSRHRPVRSRFGPGGVGAGSFNDGAAAVVAGAGSARSSDALARSCLTSGRDRKRVCARCRKSG